MKVRTVFEVKQSCDTAIEGADTESARSVSRPAAAAGRGRQLITDDMLTDAMRRVRPTGAGVIGEARATPPRQQKCDDERAPDDGVQSTGDERVALGGRRPKLRPVTMAPTAISSGGGEPDWLTQLARRRTRDVSYANE